MPVLGKSCQCLQYSETNWEGSVHGSALVFLVHVYANLFTVLAHACAWEVRPVSSMFKNSWEGSVSGSPMVVLVHVCADLFRVLAHASAWEVMPVSSMFKNKLRGINQWLYYGFPSTCLLCYGFLSTCLCWSFWVLAHACAWEVWPVSSMYRNKLRGIGQWLCYGFPSTCLLCYGFPSTCLCWSI